MRPCGMRTNGMVSLTLFSVFAMLASCNTLHHLGDHEHSLCDGPADDKCRGVNALICSGRELVEVPCRGPKGCVGSGVDLRCDISGNKLGDRCPSELEDKGVCGDGNRFATCLKGNVFFYECRGPKGCSGIDHSVCDSSFGMVGDACVDSGSAACASDKKSVLRCEAGKLADWMVCRGPLGCYLDNHTSDPLCDESLGLEGDSCKGEDVACSVDGSTFLQCRYGKLAVKRVCRGKGKCEVHGDRYGCADFSVAEIGDPCMGSSAACALDGKAMLECNGTKFELSTKCDCYSDGSKIGCR